ncbi:acyl-CoA dehydrogenase family protein, partial [Salmonella enterica]|uniref:acyl-CoA dehydrogenase family protein n=1 Tax=Salmonella enterica TaxID=28901 RepID=UPI0032B569CB
AGQIRWCQGYSEPNAGSDLASLQTRAESDGEDFIINGQKIWTSYANYADWIFCLVRTDPAAKPQRGISVLLVPADAPGITIRPIRSI